ncbi:MAG: tRNA (adenosine(37)-N6)-threonylcarbamoyltransferase complex transferase subunit TsaD, partial [Rhodospirillaceae bacterium]|nr:tRNA (adenosine(37)-N6)-threonylcarbamoyltransferase complex transferase subunit TsaD [Rhodospirillaceae bacterium]
MIVLGIETSCDETAAAVVTDSGEILAETVLSQLDEHRPYGGVVPEVAARAHLEHIDRLVAETMSKAGTGFDQL